MRTNDGFRADARHIQETGHTEAASLTGIAGLAILARLPSIDFPRSFPPDSMHLFFENVIPALTRQYRGIFFKRDPTADISESSNDVVRRRVGATGGPRRRTRSTIRSRSTNSHDVTRGAHASGAPEAASGVSKVGTGNLKFKKTSDPWNIVPKVWERIGHDQKVRTLSVQRVT
jgi:hypothetical protein